ncbi:6,7-dimethyl-8-ribityllumazine synthase [Kocuria palustris]|uniref:6,7-dimethyl-8-ribityllumazine synthase n=1 Tax=Kocuria palustris TaxID=71999 RepID=UPI0011A07B35|nr:6,7-dimethyl-8-ribityllumazine synthase [Kocuria palustris]
MSGHGAPALAAADLDGSGLDVVIVASRWHEQIMDGLLGGAQRALAEAGVEQPRVVRVAGSFELPVAARRLAGTADAIIALGIVIRGGTPHFDYVCQAATMGLTDVSTATGVPVGFGVLTTDDEQQGIARAGLEGSQEDKGYDAAVAAIDAALALRGLGV